MKYFYWISGLLFSALLVGLVLIPAFAGNLQIPVEFTVANFTIRIYGLTMALAVLVGYLTARSFAWRFGIGKQEVDDIAFWITIAGIFGARIYYVAFNWSMYAGDWSEIYKIWHGGISIFGAIIAGIIFVFFYARHKAYSPYQLLDLCAISLPLAQAIGRFGNFFNQEAFGLPTSLPWKMYVPELMRPPNFREMNFFHPAFLYEAIASVLIYLILTRFLMIRARPGVLAFSYLGLYSVSRFFIEGIRLDSTFIYGVKIDQIIAILGVLVAGLMISYRQGVLKPKV